MEKHTQTIINVCLAIFVATTIYNTNQLNDKISELTKVEQTKELDLSSEIVTMQFMDTENLKGVYSNSINISALEIADTEQDRLIKNLDRKINSDRQKIKDISESITDIESSIRRLLKPKTTGDIKNIVNKCKTELTPTIPFDRHRHTMKC